MRKIPKLKSFINACLILNLWEVAYIDLGGGIGAEIQKTRNTYKLFEESLYGGKSVFVKEYH